MFTYDLTSSDPRTRQIAEVRLRIADTYQAHPDFADAELWSFLQSCRGRVRLAAAAALEALAANRARLAARVSRGSVSDDLTAAGVQLRELAAQYRREEDEEAGQVVLEATVSPSWDEFTAAPRPPRGRP